MTALRHDYSKPSIDQESRETTATSHRGLVRGDRRCSGPTTAAGQKGRPGTRLRCIACERNIFRCSGELPPATDRRSLPAARRGGWLPAKRSRQSNSDANGVIPGRRKSKKRLLTKAGVPGLKRGGHAPDWERAPPASVPRVARQQSPGLHQDRPGRARSLCRTVSSARVARRTRSRNGK
jgi:hypothetical protein